MMKTIRYPDKNEWTVLCERSVFKQENLFGLVNEVFEDIQYNGDVAVKKYTQKFDGAALEGFIVGTKELESAVKLVDQPLKSAIQLAKSNIEKFHQSQIEDKKVIETSPGVKCWRENRPIEKVGIYIPGGSAPLFSTVLMLGIPAKIAGCKEIILCTPPDKDGNVHPAILYTAQLVGITQIFKVGGIQAIGAMTFGTDTIPQVYKIFGPGNQYVTAAKQVAQNFNVAIDMPAGPSEVLIIADNSCVPEFVAADLLSQAEHGEDSQVILLSDSEKVIENVLKTVNKQLGLLNRAEIAEKALSDSRAILLKSMEECLDYSNTYAPEHLILAVKDYMSWCPEIVNAGSVFLGNYSCESAGDYASGTNHTLPTNGYARNYSGVSVDSFIKKITFQELTDEGIKKIGPSIELMAAAEMLEGHKNAVTLRLNSNKNKS